MLLSSVCFFSSKPDELSLVELASWEAPQELSEVGDREVLSTTGLGSSEVLQVKQGSGQGAHGPRCARLVGTQGSQHLMSSVPTLPNDSVFLPKHVEIEGAKSRNKHMLSLQLLLLSKSPEVL